ncbi:hypothetical protein E6P09_03790 [Haloferax mediterranei ATCC 33500]|uniref:Uncharacterized protein n=1 Tax=Haloferax mediterranei (strain ATCC 33500 / DSM 1411 / JCM 8866 / NBRC 14739 / NCIMB 2177 / R-4) TaxID=523841 RepID=A0A4P8P9A1_HALMT|nr:hypothetical protein [Haloferax mediterranei]MDX5987970.1 hypothetical protein [Haloferax mediterranei ATCC 33500]QCQ74439.1 hypothetical protein E6P09_03790 [Haloferax mediterranei ATCC 33500]
MLTRRDSNLGRNKLLPDSNPARTVRHVLLSLGGPTQTQKGATGVPRGTAEWDSGAPAKEQRD